MSRTEILVTPDLKTSRLKAVRHLEERHDYDTLLLDFPTRLQPYVDALAQGSLSYGDFLEEIRRKNIIPEPIGAWIYTAEPVLRAIRTMKRPRSNINILCYSDSEYFWHSAQSGTEIACLILRASITGKIDREKWLEYIKELSSERKKSLKREADNICQRGEDHNAICLSDYNGRFLKSLLEERGREASLTYVEEYYRFMPLQILQRRLMRCHPSDEEVVGLIKQHINYVKNYLMRSRNRDEAYYRYIYENLPWIRRNISPEEIKLIGEIL